MTLYNWTAFYVHTPTLYSTSLIPILATPTRLLTRIYAYFVNIVTATPSPTINVSLPTATPSHLSHLQSNSLPQTSTICPHPTTASPTHSHSSPSVDIPTASLTALSLLSLSNHFSTVSSLSATRRHHSHRSPPTPPTPFSSSYTVSASETLCLL